MSIYCILGGSGTGKTQTAQKIAHRFGCSIIHLDEYRTRMQQQGIQSNILNALIPEVVYREKSRDELVLMHKQVSELVMGEFSRDVARLSHENVVCEGDDIVPAVIEQLSRSIDIRSVCLYEENERQVYENISHRDLSLQDTDVHIVERQMQHAYDNGRRIAMEAQSAGIVCIPSRPFDTLDERAVNVLLWGAESRSRTCI